MLVSCGLSTAERGLADTLSNNNASDFLTYVVSVVPGGEDAIRSALETILTSKLPIDDERGSRAFVDDERVTRALAAAELVAAMAGRSSHNLPTMCKEWAARHPKSANGELVQLAAKAVDRILKESDKLDLAVIGGDKNLEEWQESVVNLQGRLVAQ